MGKEADLLPFAISSQDLAIEAHGLVKRFDGTVAVDGVDISVPRGAIYGVLGPNGAGTP